MKSTSKKAAWPCLVLTFAALFIVFAGCSGGERRTRSGEFNLKGINCFIEEEKRDNSGAVAESTPEIHYFFDRTASLGGFTAKRDESSFVNAVDSIWKAGEYVYSYSDVKYYEYSEWSDMRSISKTDVQDVSKSSFYALGRPSKGTFVAPGTGQPFGAVSAYIKTKLLPKNANSLYVIITDLYEQGQQENVFVSFYRTMFENGLSGAIFAAESDFTGRVYNYSPTDPDAFIDVPQNGKSMFFILVAGGKNEVSAYSGRLFKEFSDKELKAKYWLFTNGFEGNPSPVARGNLKIAQNGRRFESTEYETEMVNLRIPKASDISLYHWEETDGSYQHVSAQVQAYRLQTDIGSRYIAKIPASAIQNDFDFEVQLSVAHSTGEAGNLVPGNLTQFRSIEQHGFNAYSVQTGEIPFGLKIESENKRLRAGVYRVNYTIFQKAKVPDWILERNAANVTDLKTSLSERTPKVLSLKKVFEDIADTYNKIARREVCSGAIYFVKVK